MMSLLRGVKTNPCQLLKLRRPVKGTFEDGKISSMYNETIFGFQIPLAENRDLDNRHLRSDLSLSVLLDAYLESITINLTNSINDSRMVSTFLNGRFIQYTP